jgi:hypothetical protein
MSAEITGRRARRPAEIALLVAAIGFAVMVGVELLIYEKGILRALWVSAASAVVIYAIAFFALRAGGRTPAVSADPADPAAGG